MCLIENHLPRGTTVPVIYRLQRGFFFSSIVLRTVATLVMVATNPGYYNSQTGEAALLTRYASAQDSPIKLDYLHPSIQN